MAIPYNSNFDETQPFSDTGMQTQLVAATPLSWTVPGAPTASYRATFSFDQNADVWVGKNVTPSLPSPGVATSVNGIEYRPGPKYVHGGDVLNFLSTSAPQIGVSLLQLPA